MAGAGAAGWRSAATSVVVRDAHGRMVGGWGGGAAAATAAAAAAVARRRRPVQRPAVATAAASSGAAGGVAGAAAGAAAAAAAGSGGQPAGLGAGVAYIVEYVVDSSRGVKHYVAKATVAAGQLYVMTATCKEDEYEAARGGLAAVLASLRVAPKV